MWHSATHVLSKKRKRTAWTTVASSEIKAVGNGGVYTPIRWIFTSMSAKAKAAVHRGVVHGKGVDTLEAITPETVADKKTNSTYNEHLRVIMGSFLRCFRNPVLH